VELVASRLPDDEFSNGDAAVAAATADIDHYVDVFTDFCATLAS
jgi:hypothetical protein